MRRGVLLAAVYAGLVCGGCLAYAAFRALGTSSSAARLLLGGGGANAIAQRPPSPSSSSSLRPACEAWGPVSFYRAPPPPLQQQVPQQQCRRYAAAPLAAVQPPPLAEVALGWMRAMAAAHSLSSAESAAGLAAPWPGAAMAAADPLGLYRGCPDVDALVFEAGLALLPFDDEASNSSSQRRRRRQQQRPCNAVFTVGGGGVVGADAVQMRWALADRVEKAASAARPAFRTEKRFVVAVHARTDADASWARGVAAALQRAADGDAASGGAVPLAFYFFNASSSSSSPPSEQVHLLANLVSADALVCAGADDLCQLAAWTTTRGIAFVQLLPATTTTKHCPAGVECLVAADTPLPRAVKLRFLDALDRWRVRKWLRCPPVWRYH